MSHRPTGYARLNAPQARAALALLAATVVFFTAISLSPLRSTGLSEDRSRQGDVALYHAVIDRVRGGQGYHDALAAELPARGYPTRSLFNWRTPLPLWLLGVLPEDNLGKVLLAAGVLAMVVLAFAALAREDDNNLAVRHVGAFGLGATAGLSSSAPDTVGQANRGTRREHEGGSPSHDERGHGTQDLSRRGFPVRPLAAAVLLAVSYMPLVVNEAFVMPSLWAGVLIGLSLGAFGVDRPRWGVALGVAAVFFRDLTLLYVLVAAGWALVNRRGRELAGWVVGLAGWAVFFAWHCQCVGPRIPPDALAHHESWLQFGGAPFVISTAQMNAVLLGLPQWVAAPYLAAALFGLAGWSTPWGTRVGLAVSGLVAAFAFVGQAFNVYWGFLYGPLLCLGLVRFPASLADAWQAARMVPRPAPPVRA